MKKSVSIGAGIAGVLVVAAFVLPAVFGGGPAGPGGTSWPWASSVEMEPPAGSAGTAAERYVKALREGDEQYLRRHSTTAEGQESELEQEVEALLACRDWTTATVGETGSEFPRRAVANVKLPREVVALELGFHAQAQQEVSEETWAVPLSASFC